MEQNTPYQLHAKLERNDITLSEKTFLLACNPLTSFSFPSISFGEGRQSKVSALEIKTPLSVRKVIWKRSGIDKKLDRTEANVFALSLHPYRETLLRYGWHTPEILYHEVVEDEGEYRIFSYEELILAADVERMFKEGGTTHFERFSVIQKTIATLTNHHHGSLSTLHTYGHTFHLLPYGIDLKPANLVLDHKGKLHFVDFFGPKELTEEGDWKTYSTKLDSLSKENLRLVCATREGCILRMLKLCLQQLPENCDKNYYKNSFAECILHSSLSEEEKRYIMSQVENNFPLLAKIYKEKEV